jgi:hypothetical protein
VILDPITYEGMSFDVYEYVNGSPANSTDPLGLLSKKECENKLKGLKTHIEQLQDHYSRGHCGAIKAELDRFDNGGCRKWERSFKDQLDTLREFYKNKCDPKYRCIRIYGGSPFSGLEALLDWILERCGYEGECPPIIVMPVPVPTPIPGPVVAPVP